MRVMGVLVPLFMTRIYTFVHGFTMLFPDRLGYSMEWHGHLDSLNSFVSLLLTIAFARNWAPRPSIGVILKLHLKNTPTI